jgi:hypothetical protein
MIPDRAMGNPLRSAGLFADNVVGIAICWF